MTLPSALHRLLSPARHSLWVSTALLWLGRPQPLTLPRCFPRGSAPTHRAGHTWAWAAGRRVSQKRALAGSWRRGGTGRHQPHRQAVRPGVAVHSAAQSLALTCPEGPGLCLWLCRSAEASACVLLLVRLEQDSGASRVLCSPGLWRMRLIALYRLQTNAPYKADINCFTSQPAGHGLCGAASFLNYFLIF